MGHDKGEQAWDFPGWTILRTGRKIVKGYIHRSVPEIWHLSEILIGSQITLTRFWLDSTLPRRWLVIVDLDCWTETRNWIWRTMVGRQGLSSGYLGVHCVRPYIIGTGIEPISRLLYLYSWPWGKHIWHPWMSARALVFRLESEWDTPPGLTRLRTCLFFLTPSAKLGHSEWLQRKSAVGERSDLPEVAKLPQAIQLKLLASLAGEDAWIKDIVSYCSRWKENSIKLRVCKRQWDICLSRRAGRQWRVDERRTDRTRAEQLQCG